MSCINEFEIDVIEKEFIIDVDTVSNEINIDTVENVIDVTQNVIEVNVEEVNHGIDVQGAIIYQDVAIPAEYIKSSGTAGETINALRVVYGKDDGRLYKCDALDVNLENRAVGISLNAGAIAYTIDYIMAGIMEDSSWSWDLTKRIFCGADGILTQNQPLNGFSQIVAIPLTDKKINVVIHQSIKLK